MKNSLAFYLSIDALAAKISRTISQRRGSEMAPICFHRERCICANNQVIETSQGLLQARCYDEIQITQYDRKEALEYGRF
jgi:hypothetical protein